ncbi:hypothetical protein TMatcc_006023 [Talaromyces marneffei ATCC 18224]
MGILEAHAVAATHRPGIMLIRAMGCNEAGMLGLHYDYRQKSTYCENNNAASIGIVQCRHLSSPPIIDVLYTLKIIIPPEDLLCIQPTRLLSPYPRTTPYTPFNSTRTTADPLRISNYHSPFLT